MIAVKQDKIDAAITSAAEKAEIAELEKLGAEGRETFPPGGAPQGDR